MCPCCENDILVRRHGYRIKLIAFYASPDWIALRGGRPRFKGHSQPLLPHEELGFYDPLDWRVLRYQAQMAKRHGIYGFCFHLRIGADGRGSAQPVENFLGHDDIDFRFCVRPNSLGAYPRASRRCSYASRIGPPVHPYRDRPVVLVAMPGEKQHAAPLLDHLRRRLADQGVGNPFLIARWESV